MWAQRTSYRSKRRPLELSRERWGDEGRGEERKRGGGGIHTWGKEVGEEGRERWGGGYCLERVLGPPA